MNFSHYEAICIVIALVDLIFMPKLNALKQLYKSLIAVALFVSLLFSGNFASAQTATFGGTAVSGLSTGNIAASTTVQYVVFGFSVKATGGAITFKQFNINTTGNGTNISDNFYANGTLVRCSSNNYNATGATKTAVGNVTFNTTAGNDIVIDNLTETINNNTTQYYFLIVNSISTSGTFKLSMDASATHGIDNNDNNYSTGSVSTVSYNFSTGTPYVLRITPLTGGLDNTTPLVQGGSAAVFGFQISASGTNSIAEIDIASNITNLSNYFASFALQSTIGNTYSGTKTAITATYAFTSSNTVKITLSGTNLQATTAKKYIWLVANVNSSISAAMPVTPQFYFKNGTTTGGATSFKIGTTSYATATDFGPIFNLSKTAFIWKGTTSNNAATNSNWVGNISPSGGSTDDVYIPGGCTFYPKFTADYPVQSDIFFTGNGGYFDLNGFKLTAGSLNISANSSAQLIGTGSVVTVNTGSFNIGSGATFSCPVTITLANSTTAALNNDGTLNLTGAGSLSIPNSTASGATSNTGTINQTGTGGLTFSGALSNDGIITSSSTGVLSITGAFTNNSGASVTKSAGALTFGAAVTSSGDITGGTGAITAPSDITLNDGTFTTGTGALTVSGFLWGSGGNFSSNGNITVTRTVIINDAGSVFNFGGTSTNSINLNQGLQLTAAGSVTFGAAPATLSPSLSITPGTVQAGSGNITVVNGMVNSGSYIGSTGNLTVSGPFTSSGNFTPGTGTVTFNGDYTNSGTFNFSAGTIVFANASTTAEKKVTENSTGGTSFNIVQFTGAATAGPINFYSNTATVKYTVASTGGMKLNGTKTLVNVGTNLLTLNSDVTGSAYVDVITSGSSVTGSLNVQRYLTGSSGSFNSRGYRFLSSPVYTLNGTDKVIPNLSYINNDSFTTGTGGTAGGFSITNSSGPTLYFYREDKVPSNTTFSGGNFRSLSNILASNAPAFKLDNETGNFYLPSGNGFLFYFRGNKATNTPASTAYLSTTKANTATLSSIGTLNQGDVTVKPWFSSTATLSYTSNIANTSVRGYNLVGNPYASSIDWDKVYNTNNPSKLTTLVGATMYTYNASLKTYVAYIANTPSKLGTNIKTSANNVAGANVIPSGQGFFVVAAANTNTLIFHETDKVTGQANLTTPSLATSTTSNDADFKYLRVELSQDSLNREDALVFFTPSAKSTYVVDEDAPYMKGYSTLNLATTSSDNKSLAINQTALPKQNQVIPLNFYVTTSGIYKMRLTEMQNIPAAYNIWLVDAFKKDSLDVKNNPEYAFEVNKADTNTYGGKRLSLSVRLNPSMSVHLLSFDATKSTSDVKINWKVENEANYTTYILERSTDGGRTYKIIDSLLSAGLGTYRDLDPSPILGDNYYRLKQIDIAGSVTYSNVIKVMYANTANTILAKTNISVYPNPATSVLNMAVTNFNSKDAVAPVSGNYKITITSSTGSLVKTATSSSANWQGQIDNLMPGTYFIQVINTKDNTLTGKSTFVKL